MKRYRYWTRGPPLLCAMIFAHALAAQESSTALQLRVGVSMQGHTDLLASPFRQYGTGYGVGVGVQRRGLWVELDVGAASTSSAAGSEASGSEDVWTGALEIGYAKAVRRGVRTTLKAGASFAALGIVRRHHYGPWSPREIFADALVPLSLVGEAHVRLSPALRVVDRAQLGLVTVLFRSPYSGIKELPDATLAGPWGLQVARNRIALVWAASPALGIILEHRLTLYATERNRAVRLFRHDLSAGVSVVVGGEGP